MHAFWYVSGWWQTVQANWSGSAYTNWLPLLKAYGIWLVQVIIVRFLFINQITGTLSSQCW